MKRYQQNATGSFEINGLTIPDSPHNDHYIIMQREIAAGTAEILPYVEPPLSREQVDALRKNAYQQRSDPLYMQWQYDQTPAAEQRWRAEVAAIKQEYPWPA